MNVLVDSHCLLWWLADQPLSATATAAIRDPQNTVLISPATVWELEIKAALGKLTIDGDLVDAVEASGFEWLPISADHARSRGTTPAAPPRSVRSHAHRAGAHRWVHVGQSRLGVRAVRGVADRRLSCRRSARSSDGGVNYDPGMGRRVAIAGVALSEVGKVDDMTPYALMAQASRRALADAGLRPDQIDGFASTGLGTMAPVDVAEYMGITPRWVDSTTVGGVVVGGHGGARCGRDQRRSRRRDPARVRVDGTRRPQEGPPHREPRLGRPRPDAVGGPVRPHADLEVRDGGPPPHARVRHHDRAARRDRRVDPVQRRPATPRRSCAPPSRSPTCSTGR